MAKKRFIFFQNNIFILIKYNYLISIIYLLSLISVINNASYNGLINVNLIGEKDCQYVDFASFTNGDLILLSSSNPGSLKRYFYGIKKNGREFFNDTSFYNTLEVSIDTDQESDDYNNYRFEAEIFIAKINNGTNKDKEYLISIPKGKQFIELYIFEEKRIYRIKSITFLEQEVTNIRGAAFSFDLNNSKYAFLAYKSTSNIIIFKKLCFNSLEISKENTEIKTVSKSINIVPSLSCYITKLKYIICSSHKQGVSISQYSANSVEIIVLDKNLEEKCTKTISFIHNDDLDSFIKCIHLKDEVGVFAYFYRYSLVSYSPVLLFKEYNNAQNVLKDYFQTKSRIDLDSYITSKLVYLSSDTYFDYKNNMNDIIKLSEKKICFITTSDSKEKLYIILLNIINNDNLIIRYYSLKMFDLYNYKLYSNIRIHSYNSLIAFAFSYIPKNEPNNDHYTGFMIFSYPNGTDSDLILIDYLLNNNLAANNIIINLDKDIRIENNIFGYIYYGINIKENNCCEFDLLNETDERINFNISMKNIEKIKLYMNRNLIKKQNCAIKYAYIFTDPTFSKYTESVEKKVGSFNIQDYNEQIEQYEGKTIYYNVIVEEDLYYNECGNNCDLCYNQNKKYCIICKNSNYTNIFDNFKIKYKNCLKDDDNILNEEEEREKEEKE